MSAGRRLRHGLLALAAAIPAPVGDFETARAQSPVLKFDGLEISAEHGGLELLDGWGSGSLRDPFVVVEEITGDGPAILTVRNLDTSFGNPRYVGHSMGFVLKKIVHNRTSSYWSLFEMELREDLDQPSGYFDGLSFGQANSRDRYVASDRFGDIALRDEPSDRLAFQGGLIAPGETVEVQIAITDHSPQELFYLLQRRQAGVAAAPLTQAADPLSNAPRRAHSSVGRAADS